ncbi:hypothetical protein KBD81_00170 [Candidatus Woesebacteria bacterium]|nr:hypothetical protein [Candidatus Woesebacteria bacterium]
MKKILSSVFLIIFMTVASLGITAGSVSAKPSGTAACSTPSYQTFPACASIDTGELGFQIPSLGDILTFAIRAFFVIAGLAALFYLLLGAMAWVTSGGDKDAITAAREKIQAAVLGMIMIVAVLAVIWTLEQVIFKRRICLGLSCPLTLPGLIETSAGSNCCACLSDSGKYCGADAATNNVAVGAAAVQGCTYVTADTFANEVCGK